MRKSLLIGLTVVTVAVAGYVGFNAYIAFVPPKRPVSDYTYAPECEKLELRGNAHVGSPLECQARIYEAARLRAHPGLAVRRGNDLTLFYQGRPSARLVAITDASFDTPDCDSYNVHKVLAVRDTVSGEKANIAQISCHRGEFEERFISLPDGGRWIVGDAAASPDGKLIATGQNRSDFSGAHSRLTFVSWPERKIIARFRPRCRVLQWQDEYHLTVTCIDNLLPGSDPQAAIWDSSNLWVGAFDAKVWRDEDGRWRMQATRWLQERIEYNDAGDLEHPPTFSLLPLPGFTAEKPS